MKNKLEDTIKKQHQEDFIDLDAACYYSNIPLSELCSPKQILSKNSLKGTPAILPAFSVTAAIPRVTDNEIVLIDTYSKTSLRDANIAKELLQREMPSSEPAYFNVDCKRFDTENDKKVYGYPTEFAQVILNLLSNTKDILVEKEIKNPRIDMIIDSKGVLSIITIKDNAGGIHEKNQELIFDPYYSTKDSSKGTGLGLYISKLIIERNMGGELSVYNDNEGAVFKIVVTG